MKGRAVTRCGFCASTSRSARAVPDAAFFRRLRDATRGMPLVAPLEGRGDGWALPLADLVSVRAGVGWH